MNPLDLSLRGQVRAVAANEARPETLLEEALERIRIRNPAINAVVETFPQRSREMLAGHVDGPLGGVPVVIKDEWPLPWRAQRFGAAQMLNPSAPGESGPFRALRDAGATIAGIANMHELGAGGTGKISVYGAARNPWDPSRCPGGSSSGSAAAVAARLVAGAVAADGIGSIRFPASYCGVTGLKPTFGRSTNEGHHLDAVSTTVVSGPICADAADCRLLASVLFGEELPPGPSDGLRIGVVRGPVWDDVAAPVRSACEEAVALLREETGGRLTEIEFPQLDVAAFAAILITNVEATFGVTPAQLRQLDPQLSPIGRGLLKYRMLLPAAAHRKALEVRGMMRRRLASLFRDVDLIVSPTVPTVAPSLSRSIVELPSGRTTADRANVLGAGLANLTGIPAITVPVGFSEGLPIGLQLQAAWQRDGSLLDAAEALERATRRRWIRAAVSPAEEGGEPDRGGEHR